MEKVSDEVNKKMEEVLKLEIEVKAKERCILDASEKIMIAQIQTHEKVETLNAINRSVSDGNGNSNEASSI